MKLTRWVEYNVIFLISTKKCHEHLKHFFHQKTSFAFL